MSEGFYVILFVLQECERGSLMILLLFLCRTCVSVCTDIHNVCITSSSVMQMTVESGLVTIKLAVKIKSTVNDLPRHSTPEQKERKYHLVLYFHLMLSKSQTDSEVVLTCWCSLPPAETVLNYIVFYCAIQFIWWFINNSLIGATTRSNVYDLHNCKTCSVCKHNVPR